MEVAFSLFVELGICDGSLFERAVEWVLNNRTEDGDLPHPVDALRRYPHGPWWREDTAGRILSVSAFLALLGKSHPDVDARAAAVFRKKYVPFPTEIGVYSYPLNLYLEHADIPEEFVEYRSRLRKEFPAMMEREAWHHPLFFCGCTWHSDALPEALWHEEAMRVVETLREDGGVWIDRYAQFPWWRPVWTLDMLFTLKARNLWPA